ncbi:hypothetical protein [Thalassorhabdomicrobium marinisediminis]|uniref:Uncharacterized protein n=1 Tax=Thalassorhabdomicrobium marinisediminis TaxID=2170577 RepID=A0A2T7FUT4_9RHOB|nr:hypothetical protein [Thalassorhabdomicrobium marinisediminis]PVA05930.1 hypothetical protein DC363_11430 [Thalassorhabdomicrobium marinisediminis]
MTGRATLVPIMLVVTILVLLLYAISTGRSNDTGLRGDAAYPHHICTFTRTCVGPDCTREPQSFILYLAHVDGTPRLDHMPDMAPALDAQPVGDAMTYRSRGGEVEGTFTLFRDRALDFSGTSGDGAMPVEHYASGTCERLQTP